MLPVSIIAGVLVIALVVTAFKSLRSRKKASSIVPTKSNTNFEISAADEPVLAENNSPEEMSSDNSQTQLRAHISLVTDPLQELEKANAQINPQSSFIAEVVIRRLLQTLCSTIISNSNSYNEGSFLQRVSAILEVTESPVPENSNTHILKFQISKSGLAAAKIQLGDRSFTVLLGDRSSITRNVAQVPTSFEIIASEDPQAELAPLFIAIDGLVYGAIQFEL